MKYLPLIALLSLILSACTNDDTDVFSFMEEDSKSTQTRDKEESDSVGGITLGFNLESDEFEEVIEEVNL